MVRVRSRYHAQEHYVTFVTLERIWVTTSQIPLAKHGRTKTLNQQVLDSSGLRVSLQAHYTEVRFFVGRIFVALRNGVNDGVGLGVVNIPLPETVCQISCLQRFEPILANLPKWYEWVSGLAELIAEADNLRHTTKMLSQRDSGR